MKKALIFCIVLLSLFIVCVNSIHAEDEILNKTIDEKVSEEKYEQKDIIDFKVVSLSPKIVKVGDVIFSIQVENTGNVDLTDLVPVIVGRGFSTYDVSTISVLRPGQKSNIHIAGKLAEAGEILLTIKIKDKLFYETVTVQSAAPVTNTTKNEEAEAAKRAALESISMQLTELKNKYDLMEKDFLKKKNTYDLSEVSLSELKTYIRNTESAIASGDVQKANVSLTLALSEYADQRKDLDEAPKKPLLMLLRDNAVMISAIAGSLVTLFALYEILRKKQETISKKIKEIKITEIKPNKKPKKK